MQVASLPCNAPRAPHRATPRCTSCTRTPVSPPSCASLVSGIGFCCSARSEASCGAERLCACLPLCAAQLCFLGAVGPVSHVEGNKWHTHVCTDTLPQAATSPRCARRRRSSLSMRRRLRSLSPSPSSPVRFRCCCYRCCSALLLLHHPSCSIFPNITEQRFRCRGC